MTQTDFKAYNIPAMLKVEVVTIDPNNPSRETRDESWYQHLRETSYYLFKFFQDNGLLHRRVMENFADVDNVILKFSDFTPEGQRFYKLRAPDRWESSFNRPGSKKLLSNVSYLEKQLKKMREQEQKH
jgi:hypothetical protein